jgi:hypothetical protein
LSVDTISWSGDHPGFVIEALFKNNDSVTETQRAFRTRFGLYATDAVPDFRYWAENNPRNLHQRPLHSPRVTVWGTVSRLGVVGPCFFKEGGKTVTVNSNRYCETLVKFLRPRFEEFDSDDSFGFSRTGPQSTLLVVR